MYIQIIKTLPVVFHKAQFYDQSSWSPTLMIYVIFLLFCNVLCLLMTNIFFFFIIFTICVMWLAMNFISLHIILLFV